MCIIRNNRVTSKRFSLINHNNIEMICKISFAMTSSYYSITVTVIMLKKKPLRAKKPTQKTSRTKSQEVLKRSTNYQIYNCKTYEMWV